VILLALAAMLVAVIGSTAVLVHRGLRLWRTFRGTSKRASDALERLAEASAVAERRANGLSANSERLAAATARLQSSLAELAVIRAAAAEPRALLAVVRAAVPYR
jgi:hypothetical protein